jgi:hypothetical protein
VASEGIFYCPLVLEGLATVHKKCDLHLLTTMIHPFVVFAIISYYIVTCGASMLRVDSRVAPETAIKRQDRKLVEIVPCPGGGPVYYFNVDIQLTPQGGYDTSSCTEWDQSLIGNDINSLLLDYGVGDAGQGDNTAFLAEVCAVPATGRRRLGAIGFLWTGGGTCRLCTQDNFDKRQLQSYDPNWFHNIFAPNLANLLVNNIVGAIVEIM